MSSILLLQAMYENLLVELPLAPFFLSKILGNVNFERLPTNILPQARLLTLIIWTHWIQSSTGTCSHWRLLRAMSRYAQAHLIPTQRLVSTILGQLWHRFHCCGGGVWSDQDRIAQAWGRFHTSNFWEQVGNFSFCFCISGRLLKSIFPQDRVHPPCGRLQVEQTDKSTVQRIQVLLSKVGVLSMKFESDSRNGLADVIGLDWLRMFSSRELSILISGSEQDIGMDDLMVRPWFAVTYFRASSMTRVCQS